MDLTRKRTTPVETALPQVRLRRSRPCPYICQLGLWAALALALAMPAAAPAAEGGALEVRCEGGTVTLAARDAPVADVFRAHGDAGPQGDYNEVRARGRARPRGRLGAHSRIRAGDRPG